MSRETELRIRRHVREEVPGWLNRAYPEFTAAYKKDATENMTIEQSGCYDMGSSSLLFVAYFQKDEYGTTERVIRHYYAYRSQNRIDWPQYAPWQAIEYWTESYNIEDEDEDY